MVLVREGEATHARLDAENVVVNREHVERRGSGSLTRLEAELDLGVVDAREVACTCGLVLLGLEGEGVGVHTGHGVTRVVLVGLVLVEVAASLLLETVLTVEDELHGADGANGQVGRRGGGRLAEGGTAGIGTDLEHGGTAVVGLHEDVGRRAGQTLVEVRHAHEVGGGLAEGEQLVELACGTRGLGLVDAPHQLLDGVVVRQTDSLGVAIPMVSAPVCWTCSIRYS